MCTFPREFGKGDCHAAQCLLPKFTKLFYTPKSVFLFYSAALLLQGCTETNASAILFWGIFVAALFPRPIGSVMEPAAVGVWVCLPGGRRWATSREPRLSPSSHLAYVHGRASEGAFNNQGLIQIRCSFFPTLLPRGIERENGRWMVGGAIGAQLVREEGSARVLLGIIE